MPPKPDSSRATDPVAAGKPPFLVRLRRKDYKSVGQCDIAFQPFTALVGLNGSGKSNILDSLRFVGEALKNSLEYAARERGGIKEVRRRSGGRPRHFGIGLEMHLNGWRSALYAFQVAAQRGGGFAVEREECRMSAPTGPGARYRVENGELVNSFPELQAKTEPDRLYLGAVSGTPQFRPLYDALTHMGFYNLSPEQMGALQKPDPSETLARDGRNIASILKRIGGEDPEVKTRIEQHLQSVVPGVKRVDHKAYGHMEAPEFRQVVPERPDLWRFPAASMSDGTLRALGVLVALFQGRARRDEIVPLVGIEEPEVALHPAATNVLAEAILEAIEHTQVIITSHSPDLLDNEEIPSDSILAVVSESGETVVGPVDDAVRQKLREKLYTPGELLRLQQIEPSRSIFEQGSRQWKLFTEETGD